MGRFRSRGFDNGDIQCTGLAGGLPIDRRASGRSDFSRVRIHANVNDIFKISNDKPQIFTSIYLEISIFLLPIGLDRYGDNHPTGER
jgi:hypothetical protein